MKSFPVIFIFLLSLNINSFSQYPDTYIIRTDNDIAAFQDTLSPGGKLPKVLKSMIDALISAECKKLGDDCKPGNIYFQTFKSKISDSLSLYITELNESILGFQIYLCLHNSSGQTYSEFFNVDGTFMYNNEEGFTAWNGRLLDKPYISFSDLFNDGQMEIIFNRRAHNGTWNAVETIILKPEGNQLKKVFSYYSKELKQFEEAVIIKRKIKSIDLQKAILSVKDYNRKTNSIVRKENDLIITFGN